MLNAIRDNWHKSKAAVIIEKAFIRSHFPFTDKHGAKFANILVEKAWELNSSTFSCKNNITPNPISIAAMSLATGANYFEYDKCMKLTVSMALKSLLDEVRCNRRFYSLNGIDLDIIEFCEEFIENSFSKCDVQSEEVKSDSGSIELPLPKRPPLDPELAKRAHDLDARLAAAKKR